MARTLQGETSLLERFVLGQDDAAMCPGLNGVAAAGCFVCSDSAVDV